MGLHYISGFSILYWLNSPRLPPQHVSIINCLWWSRFSFRSGHEMDSLAIYFLLSEKRQLKLQAASLTSWRAVQHLKHIASSCRSLESAAVWKKEHRIYPSLLWNKHESFWMPKFDTEKSPLCQLWHSINVLLGRCGVPSCDNIDAQQFHDYFDVEVAGVRSSTDGATPQSFTTTSSVVLFSCFEPTPSMKWSLRSERYLTRSTTDSNTQVCHRCPHAIFHSTI